MTTIEKVLSIINDIGYYSTIEYVFAVDFDEVTKRSGITDKYCLISYEGTTIKNYYENSKIAEFEEALSIYFKTLKTDTETQQYNLITALSGVSFKDDFGHQHVSRVNNTIALKDDTKHIWFKLDLEM